MSTDGQPTLEELESLFNNDPKINKIREYLGRFNPIKTMGVERLERVHSNILAWLFNPQESHGLKDKFLKAFLKEALHGHDRPDGPSALEVYQANMMDAKVEREWKKSKNDSRRIDLLIQSQKNGWVFVIENKFDSKKHSNQLKKYKKIANSTFERQNIRGVFLTLRDEDPKDEWYAHIRYNSIYKILKSILPKQRPLTAEAMFLQHYLDFIEEETGMNKEHFDRAKQIYRDHKHELDFIVKHGQRTDFLFACEDLIVEDLKTLGYLESFSVDKKSFIFCQTGSLYFSFLPAIWSKPFGGDTEWWDDSGGSKWWWYGFPLCMDIKLRKDDDKKGTLTLLGYVGPRKIPNRKKLITEISSVSSKNKKLRIKSKAKARKNTGYTYFFSDTFKVNDIHDRDQISTGISKLLKDSRPEINAIKNVLRKFSSHREESLK